MKDTLLDIVQYTHGLGCVELIKITGTDTETLVNAIAEDKTVIVSGVLKAPNPYFIGTFGMPNLSKLKTILGFDEYDDTANITVTRAQAPGSDYPSSIHFETKTGDFVNDYRLMGKTLVEEKVKSVTFKGATWNVEFEPTVAGIMRLKKQAQANSEEPSFSIKTDGGDLKVYFGEPSVNNGNFVFHPGVSGSLQRSWMWPVKQFISIMDMPGSKTVQISDQGAASITVDSGLAVYTYLMPAQSK